MDFSEEVLAFCEKHSIEADLLEEDIIEAIEDGEEVIVCGRCRKPVLEDETYKCENCKVDLCEACFGDPMENTECNSCQSDENYK